MFKCEKLLSAHSNIENVLEERLNNLSKTFPYYTLYSVNIISPMMAYITYDYSAVVGNIIHDEGPEPESGE